MNFWNIASWRIAIKSSCRAFSAWFFGAGIVQINPSLTNELFFADPNEAEYLRIISPIFLHFGLLHLVFNCLWLGLLGSKIEIQEGSIHLLLIVLISAASNLSQYYWSGTVYFGGMSGVIYALWAIFG